MTSCEERGRSGASTSFLDRCDPRKPLSLRDVQSAGRSAWRQKQEEQACPSFPQRWAALRMRLDSSLRWNDEDSTPVIPGEQRETRNPGAYNRGKEVLFLSRSRRRRSNLFFRQRLLRSYLSLAMTRLLDLMPLPIKGEGTHSQSYTTSVEHY